MIFSSGCSAVFSAVFIYFVIAGLCVLSKQTKPSADFWQQSELKNLFQQTISDFPCPHLVCVCVYNEVQTTNTEMVLLSFFFFFLEIRIMKV